MKAKSRSLPLPRDVPGYAEAKAAGQTPAQLEHPPNPVPHPTASSQNRRLWAAVAAALIGWMLMVFYLLPIARWAFYGLGLAWVIGWFFVIRREGRRAGTALLREIQAGYCTTSFVMGFYWIADRDAQDGYEKKGNEDVEGVAWEWDGLWLLNSKGEAKSEPNFHLDAPGLYPSPHVPGERELWTGYEWAFVFPDRRKAKDERLVDRVAVTGLVKQDQRPRP